MQVRRFVQVCDCWKRKNRKKIALRHAIAKGINSGLAEDFDPEKYVKMLKACHSDGKAIEKINGEV
jgi:hypothetical protein